MKAYATASWRTRITNTASDVGPIGRKSSFCDVQRDIRSGIWVATEAKLKPLLVAAIWHVANPVLNWIATMGELIVAALREFNQVKDYVIRLPIVSRDQQQAIWLNSRYAFSESERFQIDSASSKDWSYKDRTDSTGKGSNGW
jgi:putative SOS response-associated peptidase YedK